MNGENMLPCHEVMAQLWAYIDDELTQERMQQVRAHLEMCGRCYPQYNFHRTFVKFIGALRTSQLPKGARRRVFQRLLEEGA